MVVNLTGKNVDNGNVVSDLSFEVDESGYNVLRIIDANPWAYDSAADEIKCRIRKPGRTETMIFSALEIRDTISHNSELLDMSNVESATILVSKGLNQDMSIRILEYATGAAGATTRQAAASFPAYNVDVIYPETIIITSREWPILAGPIPNIRIQIQCGTAPTSGSVTVALLSFSR